MQKILDWYLKFYPPSGVPLKRRIAIHIFFWVVWWLFNCMAIISQNSFGNKLLIAFSIVLQSSTIYYGITYFSLPNLFSAKRFLIGILILLIVYCVNYLENFGFYILVLKYNIYTPQSYIYEYAQMYIQKGLWGMLTPQNIFFEVFMVLSAVTVPFLIKFSRVYSVRVARLSKEKADLEIDFLRTQLNPHFLLNSLNNIYSQVISKDETAGDSIVVLSDLMKYILYKSGETSIELDKEIYFLRNYVDLERLRGNRYLKIQFAQEGEMKGYNIAPLILISYIENAFKHGGSREGKVSLIDISIKFINETLFFRIENDFVERIEKGEKTKEGGIGIANTRKRLELLYPKRHDLTMKTQNNKFLAELMVKLAPSEKVNTNQS
jgi:two-component system, LytTR family, sensor kinase